MIQIHNIVLDVRDPRVLKTDLTLVQNDRKANVLHITMLGVTDWSAVTGQAKYRRSDGLAVVDNIIFVDGGADHVVPLAALNVSGLVQCEVTLLKGDVRATTNQITFVVREEIDTDPSVIADERLPILDAIIENTKTINNDAKISATSAANSAASAHDDKTAAAMSASTASAGAATVTGAVTSASEAATRAETSAQTATSKAEEIVTRATEAKSWAVGATGSRAGEDTNNSKYWSEIARNAVGGDYVSAAQLTEERTQRTDSDTGLQQQINVLASKSDVSDIVATKAALNAYNTGTLQINNIIKVLEDETRYGKRVYYRLTSKIDPKWTMIGEEIDNTGTVVTSGGVRQETWDTDIIDTKIAAAIETAIGGGY